MNQREVPLLNVANALTVLRLLLIPVFLVCLLSGGGHQVFWRLSAGLVFAVASLTDRLDGHLARHFNLVTPFGVVADPIADKALIGSALVGLSVLGELPWWVTVVIAARELGVTLLRFWVLRHGVIPSSRGGKLKTLVQVVALELYVLPLDLPLDTARAASATVIQARWWVLACAVVLTVVTGIDYVVRALRLRARGVAAARVPVGDQFGAG
ncbi:MAG: CDP-diacylglycerol--glycerol-3-phosphate 3-phosphatidyltransferase [Pseudonocardia sp.]|nr:CDP-diacylglycerol--glycerol-3-phosphate 3-phosphatidyltransferase [Pseudonocardia sp.]